MPNPLSSTATESAFAENTDKVWLTLVTIDHDDLATPIRVVDNTEDVVSRGETFVAFAFEVALPGESETEIGEARLRVDNVDRQIVNAIRSIAGPPDVTIEVILADDPDTVEIALPPMKMRGVTYDKNTVEGSLRFEDITSEPIAETITPERFPGLF